MLTDIGEGKYYLYRHIRLDKNEPFYIGIGTKKVNKNIYSRSKDKNGRNRYWKHITSITDFIVEILLESNDISVIEEKEKEFIKLYGRVKDGGTLCNIELGGSHAKESDLNNKPIYCVTTKQWYKSIEDASYDNKIDRSTISKMVSDKTSSKIIGDKNLIFSLSEQYLPTFNVIPHLDDEHFVWIKGFEGKYKVSNIGRVVHTRYNISDILGNSLMLEENLIKPVRKSDKKMQVSLSLNGKIKSCLLARLVWEAFGGDTTQKIQHVNNDESDCRFINLKKADFTKDISIDRAKFKPRDTGRPLGIRYITREGKFLAMGLNDKGNYKVKLGYFNTLEEAEQKQKEYTDAL